MATLVFLVVEIFIVFKYNTRYIRGNYGHMRTYKKS